MVQKRFIIIGLVLFFLLVTVLSIWFYASQYTTVKFTLSYPGATADVLDSSNNKVSSIKNGDSLQLKHATYSIKFTNKELNDQLVAFEVKKDTTNFTFDPSLSSAVLSKQLAEQRADIMKVVNGTVKNPSQYVIDAGRLYHQGEWYTTTISRYELSSADPEIGNPESVDIYYLVLKKENGTWKKVAGPSLVISKPDYPAIPDYIFNAINPAKPSY